LYNGKQLTKDLLSMFLIKPFS